MSSRKLSICVTTYNREKLLLRLLRSIDPGFLSDIEIVIIDDGSTDQTRESVSQFFGKLGADVRYIWQPNSGQGQALRNAFMAATGEFCVAMNSDDYFSPGGLAAIFDRLGPAATAPVADRPVCGWVFGVQRIFPGRTDFNLPPATAKTNFSAIRADYRASGDLKEVVNTRLAQKHMFSVDPGVRRVPPGLLWAVMAEECDCICVPKVVAVKEYQSGGITDKILLHKTRDAKPMYLLYSILSRSTTYRSRIYRLRCALLRIRYGLHAKALRMSGVLAYILFIPAFCVFTVDRMRVRAMMHK